AERVYLYTAQLGFPADTTHFGHDRTPDIDEIGGALLRDIQRNRRPLIQMTSVSEPTGLDADICDVGELQALVVDRQITDFLDAVPLADGLHVVTRVAVLDQASRSGEVRARQALIQLVEADTGRGKPIRIDFDL